MDYAASDWLRAGRQGLIPGQGQWFLSSPPHPDPFILPSNEYYGLLLRGAKRQKRETNQVRVQPYLNFPTHHSVTLN